MTRSAPAPLRLFLALALAALLGLLTAAVALPAVAGVGLAAKAEADEYLVLPADLDTPTLARRSRILAADGSLIAWLYLKNRVPVELAELPQHTRDAVVAIEDARFYEHEGIDVKGIARAAVRNGLSGDVEQGASTLTQQYVKNALLTQATTPEERKRATDVSLTRKLQEARYALSLERRMSKDAILEGYVNIAYYGNGVYGIGTAAGYYFGKPVGELTIAESALLAGIVQSPSRHDPVDNPESALARRDVVLSRMAQIGAITEEQRAAAAAEELQLQVQEIGSGCEAPGVSAPFFCDYVRRALEEGPLGAALGKTKEERQQRLLSGGLTVRTTLVPPMQQLAQDVLAQQVPLGDPSGVAATFTAVEPGTGEVRSLAVNRTFSEEEGPGRTKLNLPLGGSSGMQAGSTFKPFVLAAAIEMGLPLDTTFSAPAEYTSKVFKNCDGETCDNPYTVRNAGDSAAGRHDLVSGTRNSVNTFYLQLLEKTGVERPKQIAEGFGLRQFAGGSPSAPLHDGGSFVLGVNEVSPLALTAAYAGLAARGKYCPPRPVTGVFEADGTPIPLPPQKCTQVIAPTVVDTMVSIMRGTVDGPWSRTARRASIGRPVAGKTGTTNSSRAAWFVGFTPQLASAVWVGKPVPEPLQDIRINGEYFRNVYGGTIPARTWAAIMGPALRAAPVAPLPPAALSDPKPLERDRFSRGGSDDEDDRRRPRSRRRD